MTQFIAQTTAPVDMTAWTPAATAAVLTIAVTLIGAVAAAVVSVIVAWKANTKATAAQATSTANSVRLNQHGEHIYDLALAQPADPSATAPLRAKAQPPTEGTPTP